MDFLFLYSPSSILYFPVVARVALRAVQGGLAALVRERPAGIGEPEGDPFAGKRDAVEHLPKVRHLGALAFQELPAGGDVLEEP